MKLQNLEISQETFFKVGLWCFLIIAFMNIANFFYTIHYQNFFTTISSWANIFFNFCLAGFFFYLKNQMTLQITEEIQSGDIEDIIKQVKEKENEEQKTRKR